MKCFGRRIQPCTTLKKTDGTDVASTLIYNNKKLVINGPEIGMDKIATIQTV